MNRDEFLANRRSEQSATPLERVAPQSTSRDQFLAERRDTPATSPRTSYGERQSIFGAGIDAGVGNMQKGGAFAAEQIGWLGGEEYLTEMSDKNLADSSVDREGLWDDVIYAAGQAVPMVGGAVAGAVAAPFVGLSATVGAGLAGFAASWGMNAGDFLSKEEQEDPDYVPTARDLAIPTLLASIDLVPGVGPLARSRKLLAPLADAVVDTVAATATKSGIALAKDVSKEVAKTAAGGAVTEATQDFIGSVGAVAMTGTELSAEKLETFGKAAAYEGLIGGILGVPLGGVTSISEQMDIKQARLDMQPREVLPALKGEDGNLSEEFSLVEGATKQPGFLSKVFAPVMGNATSVIKQRFGGEGKAGKKASALFNNFHMDRRDRTPGKFTINENSKAMEGGLLTSKQEFGAASQKEQQMAYENKAKGLEPTNAVERSLFKTLNETATNTYRRVAKIPEGTPLRGLFERADYLPVQGLMDWKTMAADPASVLTLGREDLVAAGKTDKQIEAAMGTLEGMLESQRVHADPLAAAKLTKSGVIQDSIISVVESVKAKAKDGKLSKRQRQTIHNRLAKDHKTKTKEGVITLDRSLGAFSQEFLTSNFDKNADYGKALDAHIRMFSEQAALIEAFGIDNRLFDEAMIELAIDQHELGDPLDAADINRSYDVLRTQQRVHLNPWKNEKVRNAQNKVRAVLNIKLLGLSALVSVPEALTVFMNSGGKNALKGLAQTAVQGQDKVKVGIASEQLGYTINGAISHVMNRTGEESFEVGKMESAFFKWTGLPYLQHFLTVWAARTNDVEIRSMIDKLNNVKTPKAEVLFLTRKMEEAGLDVEQAQNWGKGDNAWSEDSDFFTQQYIPSIISLTQDTIVDPHPIDKPLWMNDEHYLLISQLKGFMTVFTNRVMKGWGQKVASGPRGNKELLTKVAPYVAMYLSAQIGMQAVREFAKEGDIDNWTDKELSERIWAAFSYLGAMGYFVDTVNSLRFNSDPLASALGPAASVSLKTLGGTVNALENSDPEEAMATFFRNVLPNMPFMGLIQEAMGVHK